MSYKEAWSKNKENRIRETSNNESDLTKPKSKKQPILSQNFNKQTSIFEVSTVFAILLKWVMDDG